MTYLYYKTGTLTSYTKPNQKTINHLIDYKKFCGLSETSLSPEEKFSGESISPKKLKKIIDSGENNFFLVDVRDPKEAYGYTIPGSELIPLSTIKSGESIPKLREVAKDRKLYIHCSSGKRSIQALIILKQHGIEGVNLHGGIQEWIKEIPQPSKNEPIYNPNNQ